MQLSKHKTWRILVLAVVLNFLTNPTAFAFSLDINLSGFTASQQAIITQAENYWESVITDYQPGITGIAAIAIDASSTYIDGTGGILGQAGPTYGFLEGGFLFASDGIMEFDSADISALESAGTLYDAIVHELAHIIGFGTLWTYNGVYEDGSGEYTGAASLAAYQLEFDPTATYVPVELDGGDGTKDSHWDESIDNLELMTGWLHTPSYISNTTIASFIDIGYTVVPLPAAAWLFFSGLLGLIGWSRRTQAA
jgi:hypothetical protein